MPMFAHDSKTLVYMFVIFGKEKVHDKHVETPSYEA